MRNITRKEIVKITSHTNPEEIPEETVLDHYVLDEFECKKCGADMVLRQWAKSHNANTQCLNPECDNGAGLR